MCFCIQEKCLYSLHSIFTLSIVNTYTDTDRVFLEKSSFYKYVTKMYRIENRVLRILSIHECVGCWSVWGLMVYYQYHGDDTLDTDDDDDVRIEKPGLSHDVERRKEGRELQGWKRRKKVDRSIRIFFVISRHVDDEMGTQPKIFPSSSCSPSSFLLSLVSFMYKWLLVHIVTNWSIYPGIMSSSSSFYSKLQTPNSQLERLIIPATPLLLSFFLSFSYHVICNT